MNAFTTHKGKVIPLDRSNVDTDAILPKQYLKSIKLSGYSDWLFDDERYLDAGEVTTEISKRRINPDFVLNMPVFEGASIILAQNNFGCGSSREHAVWALRDYGIRTIIAISFADIFYNNCFKNGILPVTLSKQEVDDLFFLSRQTEILDLRVDLETCEVFAESHEKQWSFKVDDARRQNLLNGKDEIAVTLEYTDLIRDFEINTFKQEPWLESAVTTSVNKI